MNINSTKFTEYIAKKKEECTSREKLLKEDSRQDEANLCKIQFNVYDIFEILYEGARKMMDKREFASIEEKEMAVYQEFMSRSIRIPSGWRENLSKAKKFGASDKAAIEEIKLAVVDEIMDFFEQCCEK